MCPLCPVFTVDPLLQGYRGSPGDRGKPGVTGLKVSQKKCWTGPEKLRCGFCPKFLVVIMTMLSQGEPVTRGSSGLPGQFGPGGNTGAAGAKGQKGLRGHTVSNAASLIVCDVQNSVL